MSEGTWTELNMTLKESTSPLMSGGTFGYHDGRFTLHEESAEAKEQRKKENEAFLSLIQVNAEILPPTGLASIEPGTRESLEKFLGQYGAEALALARNPDCVLWTDDFVQAQAAAGLFGARRAWTQVVLASLAGVGLMTQQEYSEATARLVGMQFTATTFDCSVIVEAHVFRNSHRAGIRSSKCSTCFLTRMVMYKVSSGCSRNSQSSSIKSNPSQNGDV
jgi:hypothetical protein